MEARILLGYTGVLLPYRRPLADQGNVGDKGIREESWIAGGSFGKDAKKVWKIGSACNELRGRELRNPVVDDAPYGRLEEHAVPRHVLFAARTAIQTCRGGPCAKVFRSTHADEGAAFPRAMWREHCKLPTANVEDAIGN